jgi:uncharacterized protein (DUF1778 family)
MEASRAYNVLTPAAQAIATYPSGDTMSTSTDMPDEGRTERLNFRLTAQQSSVIRRAAQIEGKSMSDFVLDAATSAACNAISDQQLFTLDDEEFDRLLAILDAPPKPDPKLRKLFEDTAKFRDS